MTFSVNTIYLLRDYTYDVTTTDWLHFTCIRRHIQHDEGFCTPPERLKLVKGESPDVLVWGRISAVYTITLGTKSMAFQATMKGNYPAKGNGMLSFALTEIE